jgi:hypothetical protein
VKPLQKSLPPLLLRRDIKQESKRGFASLTYPSPSLGKGGGHRRKVVKYQGDGVIQTSWGEADK